MTTVKQLGDRLFEAVRKDHRERTATAIERLVERLRQWRNADHEDAIALTRHEVCTLLDGIHMQEEYIIGLELALDYTRGTD